MEPEAETPEGGTLAGSRQVASSGSPACGFTEQQAFALLREVARRTNRKITDVADAVTLSLRLFPAQSIG